MQHVDVQGAHIPQLGLGTWRLMGRECTSAVLDALALGYRHIDTAQMYENEGFVGMGIRNGGVPRDEVWLTTKLDRGNLTRDRVISSTHDSLKNLGTDYLDLLLIHWPDDNVPLAETIEAMQALVDRKVVRHIGVSNFPPSWLKAALALGPILTNQVEYHPYLNQENLLGLCRRSDVALTAYSPLAKGRMQGDPTLQELGRAHGKSAAQVTLRWLAQQEGVVAIPKARSSAHLRENLDVFDFELAPDELRRINSLLHKNERIIDPAWAPAWGT